MKNSSKIFIAIIGTVIIAGTSLYLIRHQPTVWKFHALPPQKTAHAVGADITKDQFVFAGFTTPEAALESAFWARLNYNYDTIIASDSPGMQVEEMADSKDRKNFEADMQKTASKFKSMQIIAKKTLSDDKVELKIKLVFTPEPNHPYFFIQPMIKIDNEWKLNGLKTKYEISWDQNGRIQTFVQ